MGYLKVECLENHFELDVQISPGKFSIVGCFKFLEDINILEDL